MNGKHRAYAAVLLAFLAILIATLFAWDIPGCMEARKSNVSSSGFSTWSEYSDATAGLFPGVRRRTVTSGRPLQGFARGVYRQMDGIIRVEAPATERFLWVPVLRHEYGHALMDDLCSEGLRPGTAREYAATYRVNLSTTIGKRTPRPIVAWLYGDEVTAVFDAYAASPENAYGDPYYDSSFAEFFAESYATYLANRSDVDFGDGDTFSTRTEPVAGVDPAFDAISSRQLAQDERIRLASATAVAE